MIKSSVNEYAAAIRDRYKKGNRTEKKQILDEFVKVTGYHRKAAIRLLLRVAKSKNKSIGRPGYQVSDALSNSLGNPVTISNGINYQARFITVTNGIHFRHLPFQGFEELDIR
jgi:hypothetical protein